MFNLWAQIATIIAVIGLGVAVGRLIQKVDDVKDKVNGMDKKLNNGYQCKFHSDITEKLGKVEGQIITKKD